MKKLRVLIGTVLGLLLLAILGVLPARSGAPGPSSDIVLCMAPGPIFKLTHQVGYWKEEYCVTLEPVDWWCAPERFTLSESVVELELEGKEKLHKVCEPFLEGQNSSHIKLDKREVVLLPEESLETSANTWAGGGGGAKIIALHWTLTISGGKPDSGDAWYGRYRITRKPDAKGLRVVHWDEKGTKREDGAFEDGAEHGRRLTWDKDGELEFDNYWWRGNLVEEDRYKELLAAEQAKEKDR